MKLAAGLLLCAGCAQALHQTPSIESIARASEAGAPELLAQAEAAWARRGEPGQAAAAEELYLQAARADPRRPETFAGAIRAKAFRIGREKDGAERTRLAESAVALGQLCEEIPQDYRLAAALGLQARERPATGKDGIARMNDLLRRAVKTDPGVDHGGPHRLLAILRLRAPSWPLGPGDTEAALPEAEAAVRAAPDFPPNQLALEAESRAVYSRALELATTAVGRGDPDAPGWADDARAALR